MARDITLTFDDGTSHTYKGAPDDITPDQVISRAGKDFAGKGIENIDGGRGGQAPAQEPAQPKVDRWGRSTEVVAPKVVEQKPGLFSRAADAVMSGVQSLADPETYRMARTPEDDAKAAQALRGLRGQPDESSVLDGPAPAGLVGQPSVSASSQGPVGYEKVGMAPPQPRPVDQSTPAPMNPAHFRKIKDELAAMPRQDREKLQQDAKGWRGTAAKAANAQIDQAQAQPIEGTRSPEQKVQAWGEDAKLDKMADTPRDALTMATDFGRAIRGGTANLAGSTIKFASPSNEFADALLDVAKEEFGSVSDVQKAKEERMRRRVSSVDQDSIIDQAGAYLSGVANDPSLALTEIGKQVSSLMTLGAVGSLGRVAGAGVVWAGEAVSPVYAISRAIGSSAGVASRVPVATSVAAQALTGASMGGGDAVQQTYEQLMDKKKTPDALLSKNPDYQKVLQAAISEGQTPQVAAETARQAIAESRARLASIVPALMGALAGTTGLQSHSPVSSFAGKSGRAATETLGELGEEGATQVSSNVAIGSIDPSHSWSRDLGQTLGQTLVGTGPMAGVAYLQGGNENAAPGSTQPRTPTPLELAHAKGFTVSPPLTTDTPSTQRSKLGGMFKDLGSMYGLPKEAVDATIAAADGQPLGAMGGFLKRAAAAMQRRGLFAQDPHPDVMGVFDGPHDPEQQAREQEQAQAMADEAAQAPESQADFSGLADQPAPAMDSPDAVPGVPQGSIAEAMQQDAPQEDAPLQQASSIAQDDAQAEVTTETGRRGEVGGAYTTGDVLTTSSGRSTSPFPKVDTSSNGKAVNTLKRVDGWLMQNALDEANARGDDFNARTFGASLKNPTQSDKDSAEEYLFGEQPAVVPSILKPLSAPTPQAEAAAPAFEIDRKADGTVTVLGDPSAIKAAFPGVKGIAGTRGVTYGKSVAPSVVEALTPKQPAPDVAESSDATDAAPAKIFKTRKAAEVHRNSLGNGMRLQKVKGGYKLRAKSDAELAAEAKSAQRLKQGKTTDVQGDSLLVAIAKAGGLAMSEKADTIGEGNKNAGGKMVFTTNGKPLDIMAQTLAEDGYIPPQELESDGGISWLQNAIGEEFGGHAQHFSHNGEDWMRKRAEAERGDAPDYEAAGISDENLSEDGYFGLTDEEAAHVNASFSAELDAQLDGNDLAEEAFWRSVSDVEQQEEDHARQEQDHSADAENAGRDRGDQEPATQEPTQGDRRSTEAQGQNGEEQEGLTLESQSLQDLQDKADREEAATKSAATKKAIEQERLRRAAEARDNKHQADATVDNFQLGQSADEQLAAQDGLFGDGAQNSAQSNDATNEVGATKAAAGEQEVVPAQVLRSLNYAIDGLRRVDEYLAGVERATGKGHRLSTELRDKMADIRQYEGKIAMFRSMAAKKGIDADQVIAEHGGLPDLTRYGDPAKRPVTPQVPPPAKSIKMDNGDSVEMRQAKADAMKALGDLADIFGKNTKLNMVPEQEQKILPVLTRLFDAAFRMGYLKFKDAAKFALDQIRGALGNDVADQITLEHLQGGYIGMSGRYKGKGADAVMDVAKVGSLSEITDNQEKESANNASNPRNDLESDRQDTASGERVLAQPDGNESGRPDQGAGQAGDRAGSQGRGRDGDQGLRSGGATLERERGDQPVSGGETVARPTLVPAGADIDQRGGGYGDTGIPVETVPAGATRAVSQDGLAQGLANKAQRTAPTEIKPGDLDNIRETLPLLQPKQQEDVHKAETRFAKPDGYGMLFTNGTGTGKTYTGLGVVKRFALQGKENTIVVVPSDKIMEDWISTGKRLGLNITPLANTQDAGKGIVITTYANFGDNKTIGDRKWDLVVTDEAHYLMQAEDGKPTNSLAALRAITMHPDGAHTLHEIRNRADIDLLKQVNLKLKDIAGNGVSSSAYRQATAERAAELEIERDKLNAKLSAAREAIKQEVADAQASGRARVTFLSATPFAYVPTVDWSNGYLFDYREGQSNEGAESRGYNSGSNRERFFMQHFGYRMRYNKLARPDAKVNVSLMERQFNGWLRKSGALSGRMLEVEADYDRRFVLVDSAIGSRIDEALTWVSDQGRADKETGREAHPGFRALSDVLNKKFDYLSRRYLLEAIKAQESIAHVKAHLDMGRKVVVFHDYKKGGGFNPFDIEAASEQDEELVGAGDVEALNEAIREFRREFSDLVRYPFAVMPSPIEAYKKAFPQVLLFNGDVKPADRRANVAKFQDDATGPTVILVQSAAGKEGISLHDTTGKHQRALLNLGQPTQPTTAIQQEGRIYRTGQKTDAMFRYFNTGTNWEKWAFATTIATRSSTAENLSMGEQARALKDAFIAAFEESDAYPAGHEGEGKGGKERDKAANEALTEFDRAVSFYFGTQKKNSRTKAQEGADYFATPEPLGLKMVEWLGAHGGDHLLEPSAGHGAIARWMPENTERTAVEPSPTLRPRLAMAYDGKIIATQFEDLHVSNKFDGIVMNPPFGVGGKLAIEHLAKAATHLRAGGRIVALIPTGPAADKRFDKWFYDESTKPLKPLGIIEIAGKETPIYKGDTVEARGGWAPSGTVTGWRDGAPLVKEAAPEFRGVGSSLVAGSDIRSVKPTGPRTEAFRPAEGLHLVAEIQLPQSTFERAGTGVATRVMVIERPIEGQNPPGPRTIDMRDASDINALFDRLRHTDVGNRAKPEPVEDDGGAALGKALIEKVSASAGSKAEAQSAGSARAADAGMAIVEHTTGKGKLLKGVVRTDLTQAQAKEIDAYTFKKDGGFFIRAEHIPALLEKFPSDTGGGVAQEPIATYHTGTYETDLFGHPVQTTARASRAKAAERPAESGDVQRAGDVQDTAAPAGEYFARTIIGSTQQRRLGASVVKTASQAAAATRYLYKSAVERFDAIVTDENHKPLAVVGGFKGALSQTSVYASTIVGEAIRIKGAAHIWFSHNHPSGVPDLSSADEYLWRSIQEVLRGSGIKPLGLIAVGNNKFGYVEDGGHSGTLTMDAEGMNGGAIVPVVDREVVESSADARVIDSPVIAKQVARELYGSSGAPGLLLLNAQQHVNAWVPLQKNMLGALRDTGGMNALYRAVSESNAGAVIMVHGGELDVRGNLPAGVSVGENIGAALSKVDVRVLDSINAKTSQSAAERGQALTAGPVFSLKAGRKSVAGNNGGASITREEIDRVVASYVNKVKAIGLNQVVVLESASDFPLEAKEAMHEQGAAPEDIYGVFLHGKFYLYRPNILNAAHAEEVLFHEVYGHLGLAAVLGNRTIGTLNKLWFSLNGLAGIKKIAEKHKFPDGKTVWDRLQPYIDGTRKMPAAKRQAIIVDELIAHLAQRHDTTALTRFKGYLSDMKAAVVAFLRRHGLDGMADKLAHSAVEFDALALVRDARNALIEGKTKDGRVITFVRKTEGGETKPAFSLTQGEAPPQTESDALKRWFGDSKVVDADGKPLVVYHGTGSDFDVFDESAPAAHWKMDGFYFAQKPADASRFAESSAKIKQNRLGNAFRPDGANVMPVYLSLQNPKVIEFSRRGQGGFVAADEMREILAEAKFDGHDGAIIKGWQDGSGGVQYVAFRPEQIKSAIGNNGDFDPGNDDIRFSRAPKTETVAEAALRKAGLGRKASLGQRIKDALGKASNLARERSTLADEFQQGALDQFAGIKRAVNRELGGLPTDQDPYVAARLANGATSAVMRALMMHGKAKWADNGMHLEKVDGSKGLLEILAPLGDDLNTWFGWMVGNRAARLMAEGRENNFTKDEIDALQALGNGKKAVFGKAALAYADFKRSVLDVAQGAGLLDAEARKVWDNADYIPFYRQIDEKATFSATGRKGMAGQSSGIRILKGGDSAINDPFENVLMNFSRLIDASLKNNALLKTVDVLSGSDVIQKVGYGMASAMVPRAQIEGELIRNGVAPQILAMLPPDAFDGMAKMWSIKAPTDPDIIRVMRGGKPEFYRVDDPLLLKAVTSFIPFDFPGLGLARWFRRTLTRTVTSTPQFMAANFIRDSAASMVIGRDGFNPTSAIKGVAKSYMESGAGEAMLFSGASFQSGAVNATDPTSTAKAMRRALRKRGMSALTVDNFMGTILDGSLAGIEKYHDVGDAIENGNREAAYEAAIKAGKSATAAAYESKDLMDFSLRGSSPIYQVMADTLPFFNARVQGLYRLGRSDPKLFTRQFYKTRLFGYGMMMMAASLLLAGANDGEDWYEELPDWDKDTFWHIKLDGHHFRIPKPFELGVIFATVPERIGRYIKGQDAGSKVAGRAWANLSDQLAFDVVPQMIRPGLNAWANKDTFRDSPIEGQADEGKLPHMRYGGNTSATTKALLGMTAPVTDTIGLSPKNMEYLVGGYFGTVGLYALGLSDMAVRAAQGAPTGPALRLDDIPVVKTFYRMDPARSTVFESDLYKMREEIEKIHRSVTTLQKSGNGEQAREMMADNREELRARGAVNSATKALSQLNKVRDSIYASESMTADQKRVRLDQIQTQKNAISKRAMTSQVVKAAL